MGMPGAGAAQPPQAAGSCAGLGGDAGPLLPCSVAFFSLPPDRELKPKD